MHELSLVENMIETVIPVAEKHHAEKILGITLRIGEISGIVPSCVEEYFSMASKGTIAEGAALHMETIPAAIHCRACGADSRMQRGMFRCPSCGSTDFELTAGREFYVDHLEIT